MACEYACFLWDTLPCAPYINSLRFCFLIQGVAALSEWEMTPFGPWVLAVATFASMELFPAVFLPTSPRVGGCNGFGAAMELDSCYL